ncbi:hypothetical protein EC973_004593 [Apophysomyces ossiformis]|uniref:Uncharacterized protein n=1 Tax=Apophysomyces ossiformis TaxID=679940 RepID=A0A8H7BPX6_9FUNG|nr:hypothetical protein EC973_004593 [Apophysomyces ossiformis]
MMIPKQPLISAARPLKHRWASMKTQLRCMSQYSHMSDNDPEVLEREKQKSLRAQDKQWNEKLASHSEAAVKADSEDDVPFDKLQRESAEKLKKEEKETD